MFSVTTKPYFVRAIYDWCCDSGLTPYLLVKVDSHCRVPKAFVREGEIVLNISPEATHALEFANEWIEFQARFNGVVEHIFVPIGRVAAIYARENGEGMPFEVSESQIAANLDVTTSASQGENAAPLRPLPSGKPKLTRIK